MAADRNPSALRWLIGVELGNYRRRVGLKQADAAKAAGMSIGKLSHLETGERQQRPADIAKVLESYNAPQHDVNRLTSLAEVPDQSNWWGAWRDAVPDWMTTIIGLERLASREFVFEPIVIPGLLQTEDYARELSRAGRRVRDDRAEQLVEVRMGRARRLTSDNPLHLHATVNEQALKLRVGTTEIMKAQYEHLCAIADRPNVTIQVVVPDRGPHAAVTGQFVVLDFEQARPIAYAEVQDGAVYIQQPGEVDTYRDTARSLEETALPPDDSVHFIASLIDQL
ncbi:transcriptional regulator [Actinophytocola xinjiangensis]|uniref:Transcriptional regulator n=1 Tax=Actinophytocola xinjiangensis TaxID=485602 RepID=A0A7Z0WH66_9PSEU|nr:helix-turn-helix transcriptional regulator [Actinophytocola xinjiangensis]OLF06656.1 transcriptional regulator [Actinophytocola xinjiangensis]